MNFAVINTPIGFLKITEEDDFITEIKYAGETAEEISPSTPLLEKAVNQLYDYFLGNLKEFDLPINPKVSPYRKKVLEELIKVPLHTRNWQKKQATPRLCVLWAVPCAQTL